MLKKFALIVSLMLSLFVFCSIPTDPHKNPDNLKVTISVKSPETGIIIQDQVVTFGIDVYLPQHAQKMTVSSGKNKSDTIIKITEGTTNTTSFSANFTYLIAQPETLSVAVLLTNGNYKIFTKPLVVLPKALKVAFVTKPGNHYAPVNARDTMKFTAATDPVGGAIMFSVKSAPALDTSDYKLIASVQSLLLITNITYKDIFTITCFAKSGTATDSTQVILTTFNKPVFSEIKPLNELKVSKQDTLRFRVLGDSTDSLFLKLTNSSDTKAKVEQLTTKPDSFIIVCTPEEVGKLEFKFLVTSRFSSDTFSVVKNVIQEKLPVWKQSSTVINTKEGIKAELPLKLFLADTTIDSNNLSFNKGSISGTTWNMYIPWGSKSSDTAIITATRKDTTAHFNIVMHISANDSTAPVILLITPANKNFSTSASEVTCQFSIFDSISGIGGVTFKNQQSILVDTSHTGNVYQCTIKDLQHGRPVTLKVSAWDVSMKKNSDTLTMNIMRDTTLGILPVIVENPQNKIAKLGDRVIFTINATGPNLKYQWQNGSIKAGTTPACTSTILTSSDDGSTWYCIVSNSAGEVISTKATLSIGYTLTYHGNMYTNGSIPSDSQLYTHKAHAIIRGNNDKFFRDGYTFAGWNTKQDGSGNSYTGGSELEFDTANVILYARWTANTYKLTFIKNDTLAIGTMIDQVIKTDSVAVLNNCLYTKTGWSFAGWSTTPDGTAVYPDHGTIKMKPGNDTLYAKWSINKYTVTYIQNGGAGLVPAPITKEFGSSFTIEKGTLGNTEWQFIKWNTRLDASGTSYAVGDTYFIGNSSDTLYAIWAALKDADGNVYTTVTIGTQVWMVENFRSTKYNDNSPITATFDSSAWNNSVAPSYCYIGNITNTDSIKELGALYNWYAVETKKLEPAGWHVPDTTDWNTLERYLIANGFNYDNTTTDDKIAKALASNYGWSTNAGIGTPGNDSEKNNRSGFSGPPGGSRNIDGNFLGRFIQGYWWCSTGAEFDTNFAHSRSIYYGTANLYSIMGKKGKGYSVRLIRNK